MVTEICRIVPKWSPTPVTAPPGPGLTFQYLLAKGVLTARCARCARCAVRLIPAEFLVTKASGLRISPTRAVRAVRRAVHVSTP